MDPRAGRLLGLLALVAAVVVVALVVLDDGDASTDDTTATSPADATEAPASADSTDAAPEAGDGAPTPTGQTDVPANGFTIAATGDVLVHESVAAAASPTGDAFGTEFDFGPMFDMVRPTLSDASLAICHLETPLSADNARLSYYPVFWVPHQVGAALAGAGFDACSTASNHSLDVGETGVFQTLDVLDRVGIESAGMARSAAEADEITLLDANGYTVAHLSYTYGFNSGPIPEATPWLANVTDVDAILAEAARARAGGADFVVLSIHWGDQYRHEITEEQAQQAQQLLASPDIDLILGASAHVIQPFDRIGDEYVVYGMGNFVSNQSPETCPSECPPGVEDGIIVQVTVTETAPGELQVTALDYLPTWVDRRTYTVVPADGSANAPDLTDRLVASRERTDTVVGSLGWAPSGG